MIVKITRFGEAKHKNSFFSPTSTRFVFNLSYKVGGAGFEPAKVAQQIYSLPRLTASVSSQILRCWKQQSQRRDSNPWPADYKSAALANWATLAGRQIETHKYTRTGAIHNMNGPCYRLWVLEKLKKDFILEPNPGLKMLRGFKTKKSGLYLAGF